MIKRRSHNDRKRHRLARMFMSHNMSDKTQWQQQSDFALGLKVESGTLSTCDDVTRAMEMLLELVNAEKMTKDHSDNIKMDLAQKLAGFTISSKIK